MKTHIHTHTHTHTHTRARARKTRTENYGQKCFTKQKQTNTHTHTHTTMSTLFYTAPTLAVNPIPLPVEANETNRLALELVMAAGNTAGAPVYVAKRVAAAEVPS